MFATLRRISAFNSAEVLHMITFSNITHRWLPLYLANTNTNTNANANTNTCDADDKQELRKYLSNHVNEMWKKYL
jgi:hypothetical protein